MTTGPFQLPSPLAPTVLVASADHAVNASNADIQHGVPTNAATVRAWTNTYRRMRHGFATRNLGRHLFYLIHYARSLVNPLHEPEDRSRNCGLRPQSDTNRRRCELLDRRSQGELCSKICKVRRCPESALPVQSAPDL